MGKLEFRAKNLFCYSSFRCGISNAIYLVEEFGRYKAEKYGGSMEAVETALISTSTTTGCAHNTVSHCDFYF